MEWIQGISAIGTLFAIIFGIVAVVRNSKKDNADDGKAMGIILTELGYIKSGVDDVKKTQQEQQQTINGILTRLAVVEDRSKPAGQKGA